MATSHRTFVADRVAGANTPHPTSDVGRGIGAKEWGAGVLIPLPPFPCLCVSAIAFGVGPQQTIDGKRVINIPVLQKWLRVDFWRQKLTHKYSRGIVRVGEQENMAAGDSTLCICLAMRGAPVSDPAYSSPGSH